MPQRNRVDPQQRRRHGIIVASLAAVTVLGSAAILTATDRGPATRVRPTTTEQAVGGVGTADAWEATPRDAATAAAPSVTTPATSGGSVADTAGAAASHSATTRAERSASRRTPTSAPRVLSRTAQRGVGGAGDTEGTAIPPTNPTSGTGAVAPPATPSGPPAGDGTAARPDPRPVPADPAAVPPFARPLIVEDEFNGDRLSEDWHAYANTYGDGNRELACLSPALARVSGGALRLTAVDRPTTCPNGETRRFGSGFVGSRETGTYYPRYGYFEITARIPHGHGLAPSFWLRHRDGAKRAEIDVMNAFHAQTPGWTSAAVQWNGVRNLVQASTAVEDPSKPGIHRWGVDISPAPGGIRLRFTFDGRVYRDEVIEDAAPMLDHPGEGLWDVALNLTVGGDWAGDPDGPLGCVSGVIGCSNSPLLRRATFPATFEVLAFRYYGG